MKKPDKKTPVSNSGLEWKSRGIRQKDALFPVRPGSGELPENYTADLREAFPDMRGLSPRNLKYMRSFAAAWPKQQFVQETLAQITWYHNIALLEKVADPQTRLWYAKMARENGWSRNILAIQIETSAHKRHGKAITNFALTLPPADSDMAAQVFKDPYLFDFLGTADPPQGARS